MLGQKSCPLGLRRNMTELRTFSNAFSRALYTRARRETGCPPVIAIKLSPAHFGWYVEVKDGSFCIEQCEAADVWEAKYKCVVGWEALTQSSE